MDVELVSIGAELLLGYTIDTNAAYFAREAAAHGIRVVRRATVDDQAAQIGDAITDALERTGAVITSGGLGPTSDDLTKPTIAALFGRAMRFDEEYWEALRARWTARFSAEIPASNRSQAMIPEGATVLQNRHGTAPGIWLEDERGRWVAMLPGVPREFRGMTADVLLPRLVERARAGGAAPSVVQSRTLRTTGIGESALADALGDLAENPAGVRLAYLPSWEGVDLRLMLDGVSPDNARAQLARAEEALRGRVGQWIYGVDATDLASAVLDALRARRLTIAVAESCTGGMLGMRLTAIPGSSDVVQGGTIAYANAVKVRELGVPEATLAAHGAVSEEVARQMATGVRARFGTGVGVGITGIAGPDGGTPEKPVGTVWLAVDVNGSLTAKKIHAIGDRHEVRQRATQAVLGMVLRGL